LKDFNRWLYAKQVSLAENEFWNGVKEAQNSSCSLNSGAPQTSVARTQVAALTASQTDGILAKMIYNDSNQARTRSWRSIKVAGTAITNANIKAYDKVFAAVPAVVLNGSEQPIAPCLSQTNDYAANNVTTDFQNL
jgi:hypothetical protein